MYKHKQAKYILHDCLNWGFQLVENKVLVMKSIAVVSNVKPLTTSNIFIRDEEYHLILRSYSATSNHILF